MRHVTHSYVLRQTAHGLRMRNIWTYEYGTYIWIYEYGTCIHFIYSYIYDKRHMIDVCDTYEYMNMGRVLTSVGSIRIWIWDSHSYVLRQTEHDLRMRYIWIYDHRTIIHFCGTHSYMNMGLAFTSVARIHWNASPIFIHESVSQESPNLIRSCVRRVQNEWVSLMLIDWDMTVWDMTQCVRRDSLCGTWLVAWDVTHCVRHDSLYETRFIVRDVTHSVGHDSLSQTCLIDAHWVRRDSLCETGLIESDMTHCVRHDS